jgi:hypothetical protein
VAKKSIAEAISSGLATRRIGVNSIQIGIRAESVKLVLDMGVST